MKWENCRFDDGQKGIVAQVGDLQLRCWEDKDEGWCAVVIMVLFGKEIRSRLYVGYKYPDGAKRKAVELADDLLDRIKVFWRTNRSALDIRR